MAIKDGNNVPEQEQSQQTQQQSQGQTQTQAQPQGNKGWSFHQGNLFQRPIATGSGSEGFLKLKESIKTVLEETEDTKAIQFQLIELTREQYPQLNYSSLVLVGRLKDSDQIGYHILLLSGTGEPLADVEQTLNSRTYRAPRVSGLAVNDILITLTENLIKASDRTIKGVNYCSSTVIGSLLDSTDKNAVRKLISNAGLAIYTILGQRFGNIGDINLSSLERDSNNIIEVNFDRVVGKDAVGNPVRSDVCVRWISAKPGTREERMRPNTGNNDIVVTELSGYIDFLFTANQQANPFMQYQPNAQMPTAKFASRLVVTDIYSDWSLSPSAVLLAIASTSGLVQENNWYQSFRPRMRDSGSTDMSDVGALNIEGNLGNPMAPPGTYGQVVDTHDHNFDLPALGQLLTSLVQPGMTVALDCPRNGPQSWFTALFAKAAMTADINAGANAEITRHANHLTGGLFTQNFNAFVKQGHAASYFARSPEIVLNGNWTEANGTVRSINDFDYLAYANLVGGRDPSQLRDWTDLFTRLDIPTTQRLDTFRRILGQLTSGRFQITDISNRVTFSSAFLMSLYHAVSGTGIPLTVRTPMDPEEFSNTRSYAGFASAALVAPTLQMNNMQYGGAQEMYNPYGQIYR